MDMKPIGNGEKDYVNLIEEDEEALAAFKR